jgi:hypothetical protein
MELILSVRFGCFFEDKADLERLNDGAGWSAGDVTF